MRSIALAATLALTGCSALPPGIAMTADEGVACAAAKDCSVWREPELLLLIQRAFVEGFQRGAQSTGRAL